MYFSVFRVFTKVAEALEKARVGFYFMLVGVTWIAIVVSSSMP